jgi:hypothetical protein
MTVFKASEIEAGFRHLQNGDHIGKAVVAIPSNMSEIPSIPGPQECQLDPEACYLLTGGTGGLGKSIATWMVEQGARELVLLSRSAGKSEADQAFFAELNTMGCKVTGVAGRAEVPEDIERAISSASKPIKGVVHLAMVLRVCLTPLDGLQRLRTNQELGRPSCRSDLRRVERCCGTQGTRRLEPPQRLQEPAGA